MDWQSQLIATYIKICSVWNTNLFASAQRMSNHQVYSITDEEIMAIYIFGVMRKQFTVKNIFQYAKDHLQEWFPTLGGYDAFLHRLNFLSECFVSLCNQLSRDLNNCSSERIFMVMDSLPIVLANNKRSSSAKVAPEIASKGYCASKDMYYYGVKLHTIGHQRLGSIPSPEYLVVSKASEHDLSAFKNICSEIFNRVIYADKAYHDAEFSEKLKQKQNVELRLPTKKVKGKFSFLGSDCLASSVSKIRQPIESFFNWIQEKTSIQTGSKIRSGKGLIVHVFGKLAAAMMLLPNV